MNRILLKLRCYPASAGKDTPSAIRNVIRGCHATLASIEYHIVFEKSSTKYEHAHFLALCTMLFLRFCAFVPTIFDKIDSTLALFQLWNQDKEEKHHSSRCEINLRCRNILRGHSVC